MKEMVPEIDYSSSRTYVNVAVRTKTILWTLIRNISQIFKSFKTKKTIYKAAFPVHASTLCFCLLASKTRTKKRDTLPIHLNHICKIFTTFHLESRSTPTPYALSRHGLCTMLKKNMKLLQFIYSKCMLSELGFGQ